MTHENGTQENLGIASDWLIYEYWMLKGLTQLLDDNDLTDIGLLRNAVLDSFLIHARALVNFFYRRRSTHKAEAFARDYLDNKEKALWERDFPEDPEWFKNTRTRIDEGVAHITYDRRTDAWDYRPIEREISNTFDEFVKRVPLDTLGTRWGKIKRNIRFGKEFPIELPPFLTKGGILKTSFYPLPNPDWYPDTKDDE